MSWMNPRESVGPEGTRTLGTGQLQPSSKAGSDSNNLYDSCASGGPCSSRANTSNLTQASDVDTILHEIQELQRKQSQLDVGFENLKACYQQDYTGIVEAVEEEQCRCEHLEEQLNDFTELHQKEILILKKEFASMDTKIALEACGRAGDIHESLEACQTRIFKMEQQQLAQLEACQTRIFKMELQQLAQQEGLEYATTHTLLGKQISMLLAILSVLLGFVYTMTYQLIPLMKTSCGLLFTLLCVFLLFSLWKHWDTV